MTKPQIKMRVCDWWTDDNEENFNNNHLICLLRQKYDVVRDECPDFLLCGPFGNKHLDYTCVKIFYTGENIRPDFNLYDYAMGFDFMDFGERYLRVILSYGYNFERKNLDKREKFCAYIVRHSGAMDIGKSGGFRDRFFDKLSAYKRVDSGGKWRNNIGGAVENKHKWLQSYKFNICFENSSFPGYLTEKLFDAYNAGCIPIYWGDTSLRIGINERERESSCTHNTFNPSDLDSIDTRIPQIFPHLIDYKINPKAFINAHNFPSLDALVEEVRRIDNDNKAYESMRNEPLFLDNFNPKAFYESKILAFFDNIFSQSPNIAFRRGEGQYLYIYRNNLIQAYSSKGYNNLCKDALNIAKTYDSILKSTRKFRRKLKFWQRNQA